MPPFVPGSVPGINWVCPRDKSGFAGLPWCKIRRKPGFVPGFHRVCPRDKPGEIPGTNPPRLSIPGCLSRARSVLDTGVERRGAGRGRSRHRRAPFSPPSLGGGERGGNHPQCQTRPSPYPPPSSARIKCPKIRAFDGSGKGVVPRPTGQKKLCLCAFFLPERSGFGAPEPGLCFFLFSLSLSLDPCFPARQGTFRIFCKILSVSWPALIRSGPGKPNQRKVSSWTFRRGIPEQKFNMWISCLFS